MVPDAGASAPVRGAVNRSISAMQRSTATNAREPTRKPVRRYPLLTDSVEKTQVVGAIQNSGDLRRDRESETRGDTRSPHSPPCELVHQLGRMPRTDATCEYARASTVMKSVISDLWYSGSTNASASSARGFRCGPRT